MKKIIFFLILVGSIGFGGHLFVTQVLAASSDNVTGFAWSDMPDQSDQNKTCTDNDCGRGMGWISMNNLSDGTSVPYGVSIDSSGKWNGYGWSEYAGWINFNPPGPYPTQSGNLQVSGVKTNMTTGETCGWARALAGGTAQSGGWDGWISMCGTTPVTLPGGAISNKKWSVKVDPVTGTMSEKAWGADVMGWIDFSGVKVVINPTAASVMISAAPSSLVCPVGGGSSSLSWSAAGVVPGSCVASGGYGFAGPLSGTSGSVTVSGLNLNTATFTVTCTTAPGFTPLPSVTASTVVTCTNVPPPTTDLCTNLSGVQASLPVMWSSGMFSPKLQYTDTDNDGICTTSLTPMILGCMDSAATNYNSAAQVDTNPSSCTYACNDTDADNYGLTGACVYTLFCQLPQNMAPNPVPPECKKGPLSPIYNER